VPLYAPNKTITHDPFGYTTVNPRMVNTNSSVRMIPIQIFSKANPVRAPPMNMIAISSAM